MFVEAMRRCVEPAARGSGWLAGVRDAQIGARSDCCTPTGQALTVDQLAREVALSRSALAERSRPWSVNPRSVLM
jgi:hypothetical protein